MYMFYLNGHTILFSYIGYLILKAPSFHRLAVLQVIPQDLCMRFPCTCALMTFLFSYADQQFYDFLLCKGIDCLAFTLYFMRS